MVDLQNFWISRDKTIIAQKTVMMLFAGVILGFIAPYNTSGIEAVVGRFMYWVGCMLFASLISGIVGRLVFPALVSNNINAINSFLIYTAVLSVPTLMWVVAWETTLLGLFVHAKGLTAEFIYESIDFGLLWYLSFYAKVWVITLMIIGPISLAADRMNKTNSAKVGSSNGYRLFKRLPAKLGRDILCLSMEDHYVRVYTADGNALILMRMADAVLELEGYEGMQVHRSWWVAGNAVEKIIKEQRKKSLLLRNGLIVPISQRREKALKTSGFI